MTFPKTLENPSKTSMVESTFLVLVAFCLHIYLKVISDGFLLFCLLSLKRSIFEARKKKSFHFKNSFCFLDIEILEF